MRPQKRNPHMLETQSNGGVGMLLTERIAV
jgi:hypothetical protein